MKRAIAAALLCGSAASAPVQVFILMGQSNMLGMGHVVGNNTNGTLEFAVHNESKCASCTQACFGRPATALRRAELRRAH